MPKISLSKKLFFSLLGNTPPADKLEKMLVCAKAELDGEDETTLKIELNDTNRPDLWTAAGLARCLRLHHYKAALPEYDFFSAAAHQDTVPKTHPEKHITVDASVQPVRPYVTGFVMRGKKIDNELLDELIQMQEKLCENFGQRRKALAVGLYREDKITWPVSYRAEDAKTARFTALGDTQEHTLANIVQHHQKGKEYGALLSGHTAYPMLRDANNEALSMPPIINSAFLGAVQQGDSALFVECTGSSLEMLLLAAAIFACDCTDMGFTIEPVETRYAFETPLGKNVICPQYFQSEVQAEYENVHRTLGKDLSQQDIIDSLHRAGARVKATTTTACVVEPPPYRNDFLHAVDVTEDVMIGHGMENFSPVMPKSFTVGRLHDLEQISREVIATMTGLGFQEMLFPYLGSADIFIRSMYPPDRHAAREKEMVRVSNPISENYEFVRDSALPGLLEAERVSANSPYPHKMCEVGKTATRDSSHNYGTRTDTVLAFLHAGSGAGFTEINSTVAAVLYYQNIVWHAEPCEDSRFISKRCAHIVRDADKAALGIFGEIHPRVLECFNITMPCAAGELWLDVCV